MKKTFVLLFVLLMIGFNIFPLFPIADTVYAETVYAQSDTVNGGIPYQTIQETVNYSYKKMEKYINPYKLPGYISNYLCGINAGGNIIGHYDAYYDELIPNHTGFAFGSIYFYASEDDETQKMFDSLNVLMKATSQGTTLKDYIDGLASYVNQKGRSFKSESIMAGSVINETRLKSELESKKLLSVFTQNFAIVNPMEFEENEGCDNITVHAYNGSHIMAVYGYCNISYYNDKDQCIREDKYLYVASGFENLDELALFRTNQYCTIDDCYITHVV